ncbi:RluA family pseudouridine synthase [Campylobacter canadensis]|nr:RluA family pseudouridine synthase [Campylobacter canadensis]
MPYIFKKYFTNKKTKAFKVVMENLNLSLNEAQRFCDKNRVIKAVSNIQKNSINISEINTNDFVICKKNDVIDGEFFLLIYDCVSRGLDIVFENDDFAVINKQSGVLSHPNGRNCEYSLCDEIWKLWGKDSCVTHRLDAQTSGLLLIAKNKNSAKIIKKMFEDRLIYKEYIALVDGIITKDFCVSAKLKNDLNFKNKMIIANDGKSAKSEFHILKNYTNSTLLKCILYTGRQHQLRAHLNYVNHKILGDTIYGLDIKTICDILDKKLSKNEFFLLTKAKRLCLHSSMLKFTYNNKEYVFNDENINFLDEI